MAHANSLSCTTAKTLRSEKGAFERSIQLLSLPNDNGIQLYKPLRENTSLRESSPAFYTRGDV